MNPRVKKILRNIFFLLSIPMIIGAYVFAQKSSSKEYCKGINITIENPEINFVTKEDVATIIENEGVKSDEILIKNIDCKAVEKKIETNDWIQSSQLFISPNNMLNVKVEQRVPVVRIQQKDSSDFAYYLDENANPIELSKQYTPRVSVVTSDKLSYTIHDLNLKSSLVKLARFIDKDSFWSAAITQIDINKKNEITLIPVIGNQLIILGNTDDLENKMGRLFTFYQQGITTIKWSMYDEIDLRFKGQIVCRNTRGEILAEDPYAKENAKKEILNSKKEIIKENKINIKPATSKPAKLSKPITHKPSKPVTSKDSKTKLIKH